MKAHLYAILIHSKWQWYVTLDAQIDFQYWFGRFGSDTGILMLDPALSLGQARRLCDQLTSARVHEDCPPQLFQQSHSNFFKASTQAALAALTRRTKMTAARCNMRNNLIESIQLTPIFYSLWRESAASGFHLEQSVYDQIVQALTGRCLLGEEILQLLEHLGHDSESLPWRSYVQLAHLQGDLSITNGLSTEDYRESGTFWKKTTSYRCKRCGSGKERMFISDCVYCGDQCPYCEECLTMGRTRYCSLLILGGTGLIQHDPLVQRTPDYQKSIAPWGLSAAQAAASVEGLRFIDEKGKANGRHTTVHRASQFLIWAVTGAGKTEMIFPLIAHVVARGGKVAVATPRKDVVLELQPRVKKAFAGSSVVTLYGGSDQRWEQGEITIATTHQLLRFHEAFDLVIIDEIDAFPYHNNPVLEFAAHKVCRPAGSYILLSATPPRHIRKAAHRGTIGHVKVPVRFHRHPLPAPELIATPGLGQMVKAGKLPAGLKARLQASVNRGAQVFVFVPTIKLVEPMVLLLREEIHLPAFHLNGEKFDEGNLSPSGSIEGTSSKDPLRTEKVQHFRNRTIRLLVTTTILERGVTVPKSDVFILDADSQLFDEAALVQMSGRAGRSKDDPAGKVYFAAKEKTKSQSEGIKQIKDMNRLARKQGYFKGDND